MRDMVIGRASNPYSGAFRTQQRFIARYTSRGCHVCHPAIPLRLMYGLVRGLLGFAVKLVLGHGQATVTVCNLRYRRETSR